MNRKKLLYECPPISPEVRSAIQNRLRRVYNEHKKEYRRLEMERLRTTEPKMETTFPLSSLDPIKTEKADTTVTGNEACSFTTSTQITTTQSADIAQNEELIPINESETVPDELNEDWIQKKLSELQEEKRKIFEMISSRQQRESSHKLPSAEPQITEFQSRKRSRSPNATDDFTNYGSERPSKNMHLSSSSTISPPSSITSKPQPITRNHSLTNHIQPLPSETIQNDSHLPVKRPHSPTSPVYGRKQLRYGAENVPNGRPPETTPSDRGHYNSGRYGKISPVPTYPPKFNSQLAGPPGPPGTYFERKLVEPTPRQRWQHDL